MSEACPLQEQGINTAAKICPVCSKATLTELARRGDGSWRLACTHCGTGVDEDAIRVLQSLPAAGVNPHLLRRISEVWRADRHRLEASLARAAEAASAEAARAERLHDDLRAAAADRAVSHRELTAKIVAQEARIAALEREIASKIVAELALDREFQQLEAQRAELGRARAELERRESAAEQARLQAEQALAKILAIQSGAGWRVLQILREAARRHPKAARLARGGGGLMWWMLRGRLLAGLRFRRQVRAQLQALQEAGKAPDAPLALAPPPVARGADESSRVRPLVLLPRTGHQAAPESQPARSRSTASPLVSVVIPSFNYGRLVHDAVRSVLDQTFRDLEVIVVEGGSSNPDSRMVLAEMDDPRVRVLMQGDGHHAGANRNFGISQARGRYVCSLDADDMLAPTYVEKAVYLLERHGYDVVSSGVAVIGRDSGIMHIAEQPDLEVLLHGNQVLTSAVYRRSLWEQAGGYRDTDPKVTGHVHEDWVFWVRLAALGARFRNLARDPMLRHRAHPASLSRGEDVLPEWQQRHFVRQINHDVLDDFPNRLARSRALAQRRSATPCGPVAPINLHGPAGPTGQHQRTLLLAVPHLILGGAERLLSAVVNHLVAQGWRVLITTSVPEENDHGDTTSWFERHTSEIFHLPRAFPPDMWEDFLVHLVRTREVDVVWIVGSAVAYDALQRLRRVHPGLRVADLLFNTVGHTANNRRRRDLIDVIFVENREVLAWLVERGQDRRDIRLVESGVDLATCKPVTRSAELMRQIGASAEDMIVGFCGRWSEEKNPVGFVEIAARVDRSLPIRFVMTGTGTMRPAIKEAIAASGFAPDRFHLLGPVPEIAPVLASLDLLVLPSLLDGRPVVVLEALSMGVPVLASRVGALPELIEPGVTGWLCEPGDLDAFARAVEHAASDRSKLGGMRAAARRFAENNLDAERMLAGYAEGLASLCPERAHDA